MIPREVIEDIIARNEIEDVIGSYVNLKRAGSNMVGLCPFHSEKSPSFTVFPATHSFYCFGCGAGGDVITFVEKEENLDYMGAVKFLANRAGVTVPEEKRYNQPGMMSRQRVFDMNKEAAKFFHACLMDPVLGKDAMAYLAGNRKLTSATIKHFGLGYSPNNSGQLRRHMNKLGYTDEELVAGFLCGKSQKYNSVYDLFRNRVMFPIIDMAGNVIAFGGRVMDDSKPKYLNSSDTPGFKKSRNLFALNYARKHSAESMLLCEGYMDVIALHAAGFENAVATLGTSITSEQARIFAKYTKKVIISYDADAAGQNAANRAMRLLGEVGLDVRVLAMSGAKDPDEYIQKFGAERFRRLLEESRSGFTFQMEAAISRHDIAVPEEKIKAIKEICHVIAEVSSRVEQSVYIAQVAKRLETDAAGMTSEVQKYQRIAMAERRKKESESAQMSVRFVGDRVNPDAAKNIHATVAEEAILGLLLLYEEYRQSVLTGSVSLSVDDFVTELGKRVFSAVMELEKSEGGYLYPLLGDSFSPDEMGRMEKMKQSRAMLANTPEVFAGAVEALKAETARKAEGAPGAESLAESLRRRREEMRKKQEKQG